jgi:hypothetical protein
MLLNNRSAASRKLLINNNSNNYFIEPSQTPKNNASIDEKRPNQKFPSIKPLEITQVKEKQRERETKARFQNTDKAVAGYYLPAHRRLPTRESASRITGNSSSRLTLSRQEVAPSLTSREAFNRISDIYDKEQISKAVSWMNSTKSKVDLIDMILERREEIKKMEETAKLSKVVPYIKRLRERAAHRILLRQAKRSERDSPIKVDTAPFTDSPSKSPYLKLQDASHPRAIRHLNIDTAKTPRLPPSYTEPSTDTKDSSGFDADAKILANKALTQMLAGGSSTDRSPLKTQTSLVFNFRNAKDEPKEENTVLPLKSLNTLNKKSKPALVQSDQNLNDDWAKANALIQRQFQTMMRERIQKKMYRPLHLEVNQTLEHDLVKFFLNTPQARRRPNFFVSEEFMKDSRFRKIEQDARDQCLNFITSFDVLKKADHLLQYDELISRKSKVV